MIIPYIMEHKKCSKAPTSNPLPPKKHFCCYYPPPKFHDLSWHEHIQNHQILIYQSPFHFWSYPSFFVGFHTLLYTPSQFWLPSCNQNPLFKSMIFLARNHQLGATLVFPTCDDTAGYIHEYTHYYPIIIPFLSLSNHIWLVVLTILKNMSSSMGRIIP